MTDAAFFIRSGTRRRATQRQGRYEYRIWPSASHPAVSLLHRFWPLTDAERRSDIYLVHPLSDCALVKLRDGDRLEIKRRDSDVGTVQHWSMPVATGFPLTATQLGDLAVALSLPRGLAAAAGLSPAHLLAELGAFGTTVVMQPVRKSRLMFQRGKCRAEICRVSIAGWRGLTVALEASDLPSIAEAVDELHLGPFPNRSYGEALLRHASLRAQARQLLSPLKSTERSTS